MSILERILDAFAYLLVFSVWGFITAAFLVVALPLVVLDRVTR